MSLWEYRRELTSKTQRPTFSQIPKSNLTGAEGEFGAGYQRLPGPSSACQNLPAGYCEWGGPTTEVRPRREGRELSYNTSRVCVCGGKAKRRPRYGFEQCPDDFQCLAKAPSPPELYTD